MKNVESNTEGVWSSGCLLEFELSDVIVTLMLKFLL